TGTAACNFADTAVNRWQWFTHTLTLPRSRQVALQGYVRLTNTGPRSYVCPGAPPGGTPCADIRWQGGPAYADCGTLSSLHLAVGQSPTLFCQTRATTTGAIAAGRFVGTQFTRDADLSWSNPAAFWWVGRETSADCSNDLSWLANVYGHGQLLSYWTSVTAGETIVRGPTIGGWTGWYCTPGPGAYAQSFDDGVEGNIQGLGFPPALAVAAAKAKRDALLPAGYQWYSRDATCTVGNVRDLGSNRVS